MKYKTLFRVLLKVLGLYLLIPAAINIFGAALLLLTNNVHWNTFQNMEFGDYLFPYLPGIAHVAIGLYLFFGGKWIANLAIPGNRPYCHECGYDLTACASPACPECGTALHPMPQHDRA